MTKLLSIKETASYLGVDYKTAYRLIQEGEITSKKVNGIYRVHKHDVDAYKQQKKHRGGAKLEPLKCAICLRLLAGESGMGGKCQNDSCQAPICDTCWHDQGLQFCPQHQPSRAQKLADARQQLAKGEISVLVTAMEAKQRERNFITRFDQKVHRISKIKHPLLDQSISLSHPRSEINTRLDESEQLMDMLSTGYLDTEFEREMPLNIISRYNIPVDEGQNPDLILEARTISHLPAFVKHGFDIYPATLADLLYVLEECKSSAKTKNQVYLIGIAATTGWADQAKSYIHSGEVGRTFSHRLVLPCLVDLEEMSLVYNRSDERLSPLVPLFTPYLQEEQLTNVMEYIRQKLPIYDDLSFSEIAEQMQVDLETVQEAISQLITTTDDKFVTYEAKGIGSVISFQE